MNRRRIAVLTASIDREYQRIFVTGLAEAALEQGVELCIFNSQGHPNYDIFTSYAEESVIYDLPDLNSFDGVVSMVGTMGSMAVVGKLRRILERLGEKPHVSIDVPLKGAVCVTFDDAVSVKALTRHMIERHGARRFAYVCGPMESQIALRRLNACRFALSQHGLELGDGLVFDGMWTRAGGRDAAERMLAAEGELPDAVMCGNDDMALGVIERFNESGIRVPQDVKVTGYDALNEALCMGLTTISRPLKRAARESIEILLRWIEEGRPRETLRLLSTLCIYGDSCGCPQDLEAANRRLRDQFHAFSSAEQVLTRTSMFFSRITCVGDEQEAREALRAFAVGWGIREMYLCVDPAVCRGNEVEKGITAWEPARLTEDLDLEHGIVYPPDMQLVYGICEGRELHSEMFSIAELLPLRRAERDRPKALVFSPLYYRGRNFGYVAMDLATGTGQALYSILMLLSGSLMSLYLQANIRKNAAMAELTIHDIMTGLLNRRGYAELAPAVFEKARQEQRIFMMISADMDHLKTINDVYGHPIGDEAIRRIGKCLVILEEQQVTAVHISGDEFLAYGIVDDMAAARSVLTQIREEIERSNRDDPWICRLSASLGIYAAVPSSEESIEDFLAKADRAMYTDKNRKRRGERYVISNTAG